MRQVLHYNIHNLIKSQVVRDKKWDFRDLMNLKFAAFLLLPKEKLKVESIGKEELRCKNAI